VTAPPLLELAGITCGYGGLPAVQDFNLSIQPGELACLLGPSGCGKTTVLRAIAGFEPLSAGSIRWQGREVSAPGRAEPPERRGMGMVFQDYALFPHLTVVQNICFGVRRRPAGEQQQCARRLLELCHLAGLEQRYPHELSGGQQQRVALARALAPRPELVLMDEPFSSLDGGLRESLSAEVRTILQAEGAAGLLVTHDQHEAFALGERVGVMRAGQLEQWDSPFNLYHRPASRFVADFIGKGCFLRATALGGGAYATEAGVLQAASDAGHPRGALVELLLRPDDVVADEHGPLRGEIISRAFMGAETLYSLRLDGGARVLSLFPSHLDHAVGDTVGVRLQAEHVVAFPVEP
jgi:iron(III) transport system ATP-binding protein